MCELRAEFLISLINALVCQLYFLNENKTIGLNVIGKPEGYSSIIRLHF